MKEYHDILSRKTFKDNLADAYDKQADSMPNYTPQQRMVSGFMRGMGTGLRNDREREAKLKEIEEDSRQMAMLTKELTMATGKNQLKKEKYNLFLNENYAGLMQLSDLMQKGEDGKVDILGPELFANFSKIMGEDLGKFQHYKNGYFNFIDKKGEPRTINSMNLLQPLIANLPDDQKQNFKGFLTPLQMKDIDRLYEEKQLKIDKYRAEIDASKASGEASKAHAELYKAQSNPDAIQAEIDYKKAQANLLNQKANNVGSSDNKKLLDNIASDNIKFLSENKENVETNKRLIQAYSNIGKVLTAEEKDLLSRTGPSMKAIALRFLNTSFDEGTRRQAEIEMESQPLYHGIKKIFVGTTSNQDVAMFLATLPSLDKDYNANINIIKRRINELEKENFILENTKKELENNNYRVHHSHSSINDKVNKMWENKILKESGKVKLKLNDGSIKMYDKEKDKKAIEELLNNNLAEEIQ